MSDLTCVEVEQAATEFALGILPPDETRGVSAHVLRCPACRREVEQIRVVGDRLLELVPDAEPPLGFDRRVLARVTGSPGRPRIRHLRAALAGAAVALVALVALTVADLSGGVPTGHPRELLAALHQGSAVVGSVYVGGHPAWVSMTVDDLAASGPVTCQLVEGDGRVVTVGTFAVANGSGSWGAAQPADTGRIVGARLLGPTGSVIATATFP